MFAEAAEAADVVERQWSTNRDKIRALAADLRARPPSTVLTCARGSSDHAASYAKYLIETRARRIVASAAPSVASVYGETVQGPDLFVIAISQSGMSPDILSTVAGLAQAGARTAAIVNDTNSPLAQATDTTLALCAGPERSIAATKSYIAALACIARLVAEWTRDAEFSAALDALPAMLRKAWAADWMPLVDALANEDRLYVIGRGIGLGIAAEAALKLKETCGLHAEAFSAAEVRHGPMAIIGPEFPLLVFRQSDETGEGVDALVDEMVARNARVLVAGTARTGAVTLPTVAAHPAVEPILGIASFYRAANALSARRGLDPDRPPHLSKVTETV